MRQSLTADRIVDAAFALADRGGLNGVDSLSMRKVAGELGVKVMSLYNHVANKDALLDRLVERVVGMFELPDLSPDGGFDWKMAIRRRCISAHRVLRAHPWAIGILMTRTNAGPNMLRYVNATLGCLREAGFSWETADHVWNALDNHIYGFTLQEVTFPFEEEGYADSAREFLPQVATEEVPYFTALATLIMEGRYSGVHDVGFGLDLILDGLEKKLAEPEDAGQIGPDRAERSSK